MSDPLTRIAVAGAPQLAIDVQPTVADGSFVLDESELDGHDLLSWAGEGTWLNVVCDVTDVRLRRGATRLQGPVAIAEAGELTVTVLDTGRRFDPLVNADAIHAGTPIRLRVAGVADVVDDGGEIVEEAVPWGAVLLTAQLDDIPVAYARTGPPVVTLSATDVIADLAGWSSTGRAEPGIGAGDNLRQRAIRLLAEAGLSGEVTSETRTTITAAASGVPTMTQAALAIAYQLRVGGPVFEDWSWHGNPPVVRAHNGALRSAYLPSARIQAASEIAGRMRLGLPIAEDWTWTGCPPFVSDYNDIFIAEWNAAGRPNPQVWFTAIVRADAAYWLEQYAAANTGGTTFTETTTVVDTHAEQLSLDSDEVFVARLAPTVLAAPWAELTAAAEAELGRVWVDIDGRLVVRGRGSELSGPVRGMLSDWHGEAESGLGPHCCYDGLDATLGTERLVNRVVAARRMPGGGTSAVVRLDDPGSQRRHKVRGLDRRSLEVDSDDQLEPWARTVITTSSRPEVRVDRVSPAPWTADGDAWRAVCQTDIGDRWLLRYHPEAGPQVARSAGVLGIEHEISPDGWRIAFTLTEAPTPGADNPEGWFVVDTSELDSGDLLAPNTVLDYAEGVTAPEDDDGIYDGGGVGSW